MVIRSFTPSKCKAFAEATPVPTFVPPVAESYQPLKVYPSRDGATGSDKEEPVAQLCELTDGPPWVLNKTVLELALHCA